MFKDKSTRKDLEKLKAYAEKLQKEEPADSDAGCIPVEQFFKYVEKSLSDEQRQEVERHLAECKICRKEFRLIKKSLLGDF